MLRRLFDGLLLGILFWFALTRLEAGGVIVGLVLAAVIAWTAWRVGRLWRRYRRLVHELQAAEAAKSSADDGERQRAERLLAERYRGWQASDITLWSGFILGGALIDAERGLPPGGFDTGAEHGGYDGVGSDVGGSGGVFGGGDFGAGGFGGGDGGGM